MAWQRFLEVLPGPHAEPMTRGEHRVGVRQALSNSRGAPLSRQWLFSAYVHRPPHAPPFPRLHTFAGHELRGSAEVLLPPLPDPTSPHLHPCSLSLYHKVYIYPGPEQLRSGRRAASAM